MKSQRILVVSCLALLVTCVTLATHAATTAWFGSPDAAFKEKFKKLMEKPDKPQRPEMEKLVKAETANAVAWIVYASEILDERPDDPELPAFLTELTTAWKAAVKSNFPDKFRDYLATIEPANKKERPGLRKRFDLAVAQFESNSERKDPLTYANLAEELEVVGFAFEQIGDQYFASETWLVYSQCYDEPLRATSADLKRALAGLERALAARAKVELSDPKKDAAEKRKTALVAKAPGKAGEGPAPDAPGAGPTDAGATIDVPLTFEVVPGAETYQRPCFDADDNYLMWRSINLKGSNSKSAIDGLAEGPSFLRMGSADVRIDGDGDDKGDGPADVKVALTGTIQPIKLNLGKGTGARPWACLGVTAGQQEIYQGTQLNMAPTDSQLNLYVLSAASLVGTLDGQPIRIIDETMDGAYGTIPENYGFVGLSKGFFQPYVDCMVVGTSKRARPFSEIAEVNGKWWKFDMNVTGKSIRASPINTDTGTLKLEFKGPLQPTYLIMKGANSFKDSYFDIAEGGAKGVQVPVGRYTLAFGIIHKGKKKQMQKCVIVPPKSAPNYDVTKGGTTVVALGAPFGFDFQARNDDGKLTITGQTVAVTGSGGERYERPWQCVAKPEVVWRKKGSKKAEKAVKMAPVMSTDTIEKLGFESTWFPLDLEVDVKGQGEVEVQLFEKKHDLFGKIESDWK
jgi:hypothetical protein